MERHVNLTLSLPLSVLEDIDAAAKKNNTPRSHWLRDAALAQLRASAPSPDTATRNAALDRAAAQLTLPRCEARPTISQADADALFEEVAGGRNGR